MRILVEVEPAADDSYSVEIALEVPSGVTPLGDRVMQLPPDTGDLIGRFERRELAAGEVENVGRKLFDALLGQDVWGDISRRAREDREGGVEIALSWPSDQLALHRLSWEAMHDGKHFLGNYRDFAVAITRIVSDAEDVECRGQVSAPARVLFAIGAPIDDPSIRRGAELVGLLRGMERKRSSIDSMILDGATLASLADTCARFKPHIIHFVGHGELDGERGKLQLTPEEAGEAGWVDGEKLLRAITAGGSRPEIVLLTGCETAAAGEHMDSLAAELVKGGVPVSIGMAGRISDPVCRLFTRRFGMSLGDGQRLVEAMTHGRSAGLQRQEGSAADDPAWALPSIYLAPCVPAGYTPIKVEEGAGIPARIRNYGLLQEPVFCGRKELGEKFAKLLGEREPMVLIAYAGKDARLGKLGATRLQQEFASRALRAGHVVIRIDDHVGNRSTLPSSAVQLAARLLEAITETREFFELPRLFESTLLAELLEAVGGDALPEVAPPDSELRRLKKFLRRCRSVQLDEEKKGALEAVLVDSLVDDLKTLMKDLEAVEDDSVVGGPVMILGGLGDWGAAAALLLEELLKDANGLGNASLPVPVFATCSFDEAASATLVDALEESSRKGWEEWVELKSFEPDEATLAYQWVLLHPWSRHPYADRVYAPHRDHEDDWQQQFDRFDAVPGIFEDDRFYMVANVLEGAGFFVSADDDQILSEYVRPR